MKWIVRSTLVMMSTIAILATGAAWAQAACPVLDPLCLVEETVDDGLGLVEDTVDGIETPVDDVVDPVVGPVVDTILGTVDDVIGGGSEEQPEPPGDTGKGGGQPGVHRGGPELSGAVDRGPVDIAGPRIEERSELGRAFAAVPAPQPVADATGSPGTGSPAEGSGRVGEAIGAVARSLAIALVLFGLTLAFAAIQDRLDRNDPRLSLAPVRSDVVTFA